MKNQMYYVRSKKTLKFYRANGRFTMMEKRALKMYLENARMMCLFNDDLEFMKIANFVPVEPEFYIRNNRHKKFFKKGFGNGLTTKKSEAFRTTESMFKKSSYSTFDTLELVPVTRARRAKKIVLA